MTKLPLYHRPSALVFLDDETSYLEMLAIVMPKDWCISLHTRIRDYMARVHAHTKLWEDDIAMHQEMVNQWHKGQSLPKQMLSYWRAQSQRYSLTSIAVVDYAMPAANGLEVLRMSPPWPPFRVLLTGRADEHIAVKAFNEGLIEKFITKQNPNLVELLVGELKRHYHASMDFHDGIWRNALRRSQQQCFQDAQVRQELQNWLQAQGCIEYVVFPEPFGVLALDAQGFAHWLQFEMHKDLAAAVDLAAAAGLDTSVQQQIQQGLLLSNAEWLQALGDTGVAQTATTHTWGAGGHLIAAHFSLANMGTVGLSHANFLQQLGSRTVNDSP